MSPKVSVCIITYNHARFIRKAVESVLVQQANFEFEIVIGEDCSTDSTRNILLAVQQEFPDKIRLLLHSENIGMMNNVMVTYSKCLGEYIAFLDGDDFWTDTSKLQRQVDLLESRPDCTLCFHTAEYVNEDGLSNGRCHPMQGKPDWTLNDIIVENPIQTCSMVMRRSTLVDFPAFMLNLQLADWPLCILAAHNGNICFIDRVMSAYRVHSGGIWTSDTFSNRYAAIARMYLYLAVNCPDLLPKIDPAHQRLFREFLSVHNNRAELLEASWSLWVGRVVLSPLSYVLAIIQRLITSRIGG